MRLDLIGKRHPLSTTNFKGGSSSSSSATTTSETQETSITQDQSGSGNIAVSNGGSVIVQSQDAGIIANAFNFAGSLVQPLLNTVNESAAADHQIATNALSNAQTATTEAIGQSNSVAANAQLGQAGILENPVFIWGIVGAVGIVALIILSRGK